MVSACPQTTFFFSHKNPRALNFKTIPFVCFLTLCLLLGFFKTSTVAAESGGWKIVVDDEKSINSPLFPTPPPGNKPNPPPYRNFQIITQTKPDTTFHAWFAINPATPGTPLRAGEKATLEVKIQGPTELIGRVDFEIDGDGPYIATTKNSGHYVYYWDVPGDCKKSLKIVFRARAKTGDKILLSSFKMVAVAPAAEALRAVWKVPPKTIKLGEQKEVAVVVKGGTPPFSYSWKITEPKNSPKTVMRQSQERLCTLPVGPFTNPGSTYTSIDIEVEIKDLEDDVCQLKGSLYIAPVDPQAFFSEPPIKLRVGEKGFWRAFCSDNNSHTPYAVTFDWGDLSPVTKISSKTSILYLFHQFAGAEHIYQKSGTYNIKATFNDDKGTPVHTKCKVEVLPDSLNIINFMGPAEATVHRTVVFKVKIKPGISSKPPYTYTFYYGNCITETMKREEIEIEARHSYFTPNLYTVKVIVADNCGSDESQIMINVKK